MECFDICNTNEYDEVLKVEKKFQHIEPTQQIIKKYMVCGLMMR